MKWPKLSNILGRRRSDAPKPGNQQPAWVAEGFREAEVEGDVSDIKFVLDLPNRQALIVVKRGRLVGNGRRLVLPFEGVKRMAATLLVAEADQEKALNRDVEAVAAAAEAQQRANGGH